jgi:hypothetical protein
LSFGTPVTAQSPTNQNPLVAWQIRTGVRHHNLKLFVINSKEIKLERKAEQFVQIAEGQEAAVVRWLHSESPLGPGLVEPLTQLKAALDAQPDVAIVFGAELSGAAIADLLGFGSKLHGKVRYMALGDYANSRGAADMGVLPDRGPLRESCQVRPECAANGGSSAEWHAQSALRGRRKSLAHFGTLGYGAANRIADFTNFS